MVVRQMMEQVPQDEAGMESLKKAVASNFVYEDMHISKDQKTTMIVGEFRETGKG